MTLIGNHLQNKEKKNQLVDIIITRRRTATTFITTTPVPSPQKPKQPLTTIQMQGMPQKSGIASLHLQQNIITKAHKQGLIKRELGEPPVAGQFAPIYNTITPKGRVLLQSQLLLGGGRG